MNNLQDTNSQNSEQINIPDVFGLSKFDDQLSNTYSNGDIEGFTDCTLSSLFN
jgi:hypothetical protein